MVERLAIELGMAFGSDNNYPAWNDLVLSVLRWFCQNSVPKANLHHDSGFVTAGSKFERTVFKARLRSENGAEN